ncbi:hypothetical protein [Nocardia sp. CNY236]|uniref:hypothetical protein n=1 Tax=Nocardia sp. CNY236 TaxID=1169152 RepID=UPI000413E21C|nr:hypothetical protein [Nocardia sp. CNY236]
MGKPTALGYLRRDISGETQRWHEAQIRICAKQLGYELTKTIVFHARTRSPITGLITAVQAAGAEAVIAPTPWHFGAQIPGDLVQVTDVITASPRHTYSRRLPNPFSW